jgi:hypothetical protein
MWQCCPKCDPKRERFRGRNEGAGNSKTYIAHLDPADRSPEWYREAACHTTGKSVGQQLKDDPDLAERHRSGKPFKFF